MSSSDFKIGETVMFDGYVCIVKKHKNQKCLSMPYTMGWYNFVPLDWNNVCKMK